MNFEYHYCLIKIVVDLGQTFVVHRNCFAFLEMQDPVYFGIH